MNETQVTVVGTIVGEVRHRQVQDGVEVVNFRVGSTERRLDRATGEWTDGGRLFLNVTCWRRLASGVVASLTKGDPVVVTGRLNTRSYEVDGQRRQSYDVEAFAVGPDLSRCTARLGPGARATDADPGKSAHPGMTDAGSGVDTMDGASARGIAAVAAAA
ncbi:single-stranded DNA-binding protein [Goodfellowiella coeruleoviolacea]|uniref:Single-stranded DNA-binding protein n=1 Tax=Goodfellowiella coeruleoviolacea TaxID=334858 RepID=A0AAE3KG38_9PSEU|nr:single-stranded DNA-binding protein [Goodfellowiella coeruleoviolacea]MCP2165064.1 single-strand DNA-binding protein [Goodfellowiella coeruleoviolacea]